MRPASSGEGSMATEEIREQGEGASARLPAQRSESAEQNAPAWEMVGPGRYMPRRIRGSFHGRELG